MRGPLHCPSRKTFRELLHIIFKIVVTIELTLEHLISGACVGHGRMRTLKVLAAIELVGGDESALLHRMEYILHIDSTYAEPP